MRSMRMIFEILLVALVATGCTGIGAAKPSESKSSLSTTPSPSPNPTPNPSPQPQPSPGDPSQIALTNPTALNSIRDFFATLPQGSASLAKVCAENTGSDVFTNVLCKTNPPTINSLASLYAAMGVTNTANVACTTASGALAKMDTSVLTPHCIRFSNAGSDPNAVSVAYVRSKNTMAEVAALDPVLGFRFYVVKYDLPCEASGSCTNADYTTAAAESNWKNVSFYEDKSFKNTALDCRNCHQARGPGTVTSLRMTETQSPWQHWFHSNRNCGKTLLDDFNAAHSTEPFYAGLTAAQMNASDPAKLQLFVENNGSSGIQFGNDVYNSTLIEAEVDSSSGQPVSNSIPGVSATWSELYYQQITGANILSFGATTIPYHDCKQSDPTKLASFTSNFLGVVAGTIPKSAALYLADVNLSTQQALADRSLTPALGLTTASKIMASACVACHNSTLDQSDSRARFNAQDLTKNTAFEYGLAMGRIKRGPTDLHRMPPPIHMSLSDSDIAILTSFFASQGGK